MPETPERYRRFLEYHGGHNPLGEANFILHWGQNRGTRLAIPDAFLGPYLNCWFLAEWNAPEQFGPPSQWDELLGPYPSRGAYLPIQVFREGKEPVMLDSEFLNLEVLRLFLHVIMEHKHDSLRKRYDLLKQETDRVQAEKTRVLVERIEDGAPAFADAASFAGQKNCHTAIQQKLDILEQNLDRILSITSRLPRGGQFQLAAQ